jgi:16S rRNA (guanine527-N7)-methyltransferase
LPDAHPDSFGPAEFQAASAVSRETLAKLKLYAGLLEDWNARMNLISAGSMPDLWRRHFWDSAQLFPHIPRDAEGLVDLGSGAGFPGLVLAVMLAERQAIRVVLYESVAKKCRFLREVAGRLGVPVEIRNTRIEQAKPEPFDVVTARACAPLAQLLAYARPFQDKSTLCLFLKGQGVGAELAEAHKDWKMLVKRHQSLSGPSGAVLEIRELRPLA